MSNTRIRPRKINMRVGTPTRRARKSVEVIRNDEFYSKKDMQEIQEGFEQIKQGDSVSHDELKKLLGI